MVQYPHPADLWGGPDGQVGWMSGGGGGKEAIKIDSCEHGANGHLHPDGHDGRCVEAKVAAPRLRVLVQQPVEEPQQLHHALITRSRCSRTATRYHVSGQGSSNDEYEVLAKLLQICFIAGLP